jgi:hypothetical protein
MAITVPAWQHDPMAEEWYFCVRHHVVEARVGCPDKDRLGPYPTRADAQAALDKVEQRNDRWDDDDDEWEGDERKGNERKGDDGRND